MMRALALALRGLVRRAVVRSTRDDLATQLVDLTVADGHTRSAVEVLQPFGLASCAPAGGLAVVLAVGGDQGDLVALPVSAPGARLGKLESGETALYGADGSRVHIRKDGTIAVTAAQAVDIQAPGEGGARVRVSKDGTVTVTTAQGAIKLGNSGAKLKWGAHFIAATSSGLVCSALPAVGPEPDP